MSEAQMRRISYLRSIVADRDAEIERLRAALKTARPFIGWAGHYPTILAEIDAALKEDGDGK